MFDILVMFKHTNCIAIAAPFNVTSLLYSLLLHRFLIVTPQPSWYLSLLQSAIRSCTSHHISAFLMSFLHLCLPFLYPTVTCCEPVMSRAVLHCYAVQNLYPTVWCTVYNDRPMPAGFDLEVELGQEDWSHLTSPSSLLSWILKCVCGQGSAPLSSRPSRPVT